MITITDGTRLDNLKRMLASTKELVQETIIIYQGRDENVRGEIASLCDVCIKTTPKGNADPDRQWAYSLSSCDWILALDDDEYLTDETRAFIARITKSEAQVVWFEFKNLVDGVDIRSILGADPHPRLWRRIDNIIQWSPQAHAFPNINTELQYFTKIPIIHDRKYDDLVARHEKRGRVIDPQNQDLEKRFLQAVKNLLGKK